MIPKVLASYDTFMLRADGAGHRLVARRVFLDQLVEEYAAFHAAA